MLMMTFSPMSMRPSIVAEPICGSSNHAIWMLQKLRIDGRLVFEHVESGAREIAPASIMRANSPLIDHLAACRIHDDKRDGFSNFKAARRQQGDRSPACADS